MRERLLEWYIANGERYAHYQWDVHWVSLVEGKLLQYGGRYEMGMYQITPKGLEYIKNLDNP